MEFKILLHDESEMLQLAKKLAHVMRRGIIFLHGTLGAGKTTFARGFLQGKGVQGKIKSPTYSLVECYEVAGKKIFHFDLYRLDHPEELRAIGIEEYFSENTLCLIEWPEKGGDLLPQADLLIDIKIKNNEREIQILAQSMHGKEMLERLKDI